MSSLKYVGKASSRGTDITSRLQVNNLLSTSISPNRTSAAGQVVTAASNYGSTVYVNDEDAQFQLPSYYQSQDALNVPLSIVGQPNGVANLDPNGTIPVTQIPALGSGYMLGPFGPTATFTGSASNTPLKIADWNIGVQSVVFQPLVFCTVVAKCNAGGRPVVEVRISDGSQPYASQTRIGIGMGRAGYTDLQPIQVLPAPVTTGQSGTSAGFSLSTNIWVTAWIYDQNSQTTTLTAGGVTSAAVFLARLQQ